MGERGIQGCSIQNTRVQRPRSICRPRSTRAFVLSRRMEVGDWGNYIASSSAHCLSRSGHLKARRQHNSLFTRLATEVHSGQDLERDSICTNTPVVMYTPIHLCHLRPTAQHCVGAAAACVLPFMKASACGDPPEIKRRSGVARR